MRKMPLPSVGTVGLGLSRETHYIRETARGNDGPGQSPDTNNCCIRKNVRENSKSLGVNPDENSQYMTMTANRHHSKSRSEARSSTRRTVRLDQSTTPSSTDPGHHHEHRPERRPELHLELHGASMKTLEVRGKTVEEAAPLMTFNPVPVRGTCPRIGRLLQMAFEVDASKPC